MKEVEATSKTTAKKENAKKGKGLFSLSYLYAFLVAESKPVEAVDSEKNGNVEPVDENAMDLPKLFEEIKKMKPVHKQIKNEKYPIGEIHEYLPSKDDTTAINRTTSQEKKELESGFEDMYKDLRRAAEVTF